MKKTRKSQEVKETEKTETAKTSAPRPKKTWEKLFAMLDATKSPIMLVGLHGIGKSEMIAQYAEKVGKKCIDLRLSQMTEGDLLGIPHFDAETKTTEFYPPHRMYEASQRPCILFFDELNRASREVRQGIFQVADSRKLGSLKLHPDTQVISAVNPDDENYQVNPFDPAEVDRWAIFDFCPTTDEWLEWAEAKDLDKNVINFVRNNPGNLDPNPNKAKETGKFGFSKQPSRRSWKRLSDALQSASGPDEVQLLSVAFLGSEVGLRFAAQYKSIEKLLNPLHEKLNFTDLNEEERARTIASLHEATTYQNLSMKNMDFLVGFLKSVDQNELLCAYCQALKDHSCMEFMELGLQADFQGEETVTEYILRTLDELTKLDEGDAPSPDEE